MYVTRATAGAFNTVDQGMHLHSSSNVMLNVMLNRGTECTPKLLLHPGSYKEMRSRVGIPDI